MLLVLFLGSEIFFLKVLMLYNLYRLCIRLYNLYRLNTYTVCNTHRYTITGDMNYAIHSVEEMIDKNKKLP